MTYIYLVQIYVFPQLSDSNNLITGRIRRPTLGYKFTQYRSYTYVNKIEKNELSENVFA